MLLNEKGCLIHLQALPLLQTDNCEQDVRSVMATTEQVMARRFIWAQHRIDGILLPTLAHLHFANALKCASEENKVLLFDYLLINDKGYYSYMQNEFRLSNKL